MDKPEFETLFHAHGKEIYHYLWRMLQNEQDTEDCLQETFLKAYKAYLRVSDYTHLRAWLYKIANNTAISLIRKRKSKPIVDLDIDRLPDINSPTSTFDQRMELQALREFIETLPTKQKNALLLYRYQELSYPEIAVTLNITEEAARANVYQATKKIRATFKDKEIA